VHFFSLATEDFIEDKRKSFAITFEY